MLPYNTFDKGFHRLYGEGFGAVLGEHGDQRVQHYLTLRQVRARTLDKYIPK